MTADDEGYGRYEPIAYVSPYTYESFLMVLQNLSREEAKKVVDKIYFDQYGVSREEYAKQLQEEFKNLKWGTK